MTGVVCCQGLRQLLFLLVLDSFCSFPAENPEYMGLL